MASKSISHTQFAALLWAAVLAPAAELLPALALPGAGKGAWLAPLAALPPVLLGGWALKRLSGERGLAGELTARLGLGGKLLLIIYMVWGTALLALRLRLCARRLMASGYRDGAMWFFLLAAAGAVLWLGQKELPAFARAAQLFLGVLGFAGGGVLVLALPRVELTRLLPLWGEDALPVLASGLTAAGVLGWGLFGAFLIHRAEPARRGWSWSLWGCLVLTAAQGIILGALGPGLAARLDDPFFALAKSVGLEGAFQRVESVIAALWTLADLSMGALLLLALGEICGALLPGRGKQASGALLALSAAAGLLLFSDGGAEYFSREIVPRGNLILGLVLPMPAAILLREGVKGTSCGDKIKKNGRYCKSEKTVKKPKKTQKKC